MDLSLILTRLDSLSGIMEGLRLHYDAEKVEEEKWFSRAEECYQYARKFLEQTAVEVEDGFPISQEGSKDLRYLELLDLLKPSFKWDNAEFNFENAIITGDANLVELLLMIGIIDPSVKDNAAIRWASRSGHVAVVDRLLQARDASGRLCVDPSANNDAAIRFSSEKGHVAVVDRLLQTRDASGRLCVDPSANNNEAIQMASHNGHVAVVDRLLQDGRVDPSANNNAAIRAASQNGHVAVVDRLLQDGRVDPSDNGNSAIYWASERGHVAVVDRLLQARDASGRLRVDPSVNNNQALRWASERGHVAVVDRLLQDPRTIIYWKDLFSLSTNARGLGKIELADLLFNHSNSKYKKFVSKIV